MRIDLGAVLLVCVVGGCAYVEDKNTAARQHDEEQGGPILPPAAPGRLRPVSANFGLFPDADDDMAAVDSQVITIADGARISLARLAAPDHVEVTFAPDQDDFGGERYMRVELPQGVADQVEVVSDKCYDFRPADISHGCVVVLKAAKSLPPGPYKLTVGYAADAERSLSFTVTD